MNVTNSKTAVQKSEMDTMLPFEFDLPSSSLVYVNSDKLLDVLKHALNDAIVIGIDTETKPTFVPRRFMQGPPHPTSIIQIAVRSSTFRECVFVVDLLKLSQSAAMMSKLNECLEVPFLNTECIKVGQGLTNDLREVVQAYPTMSAFRLVHSVLETHDMTKYLQPVIINPISLKNLVKQYLHFDLRKGQQMSDWSRRPLSDLQLHYAACDALVLLRLYDAMCYEIENKLSSEDEDSTSDNDTTVSDHSAVARSTMAALSRTVDFTKLEVKTYNNKKDKRRGEGHHRQNGTVVPGLDLNSALLRGWQSEAQKEWLRTQNTTTVASSSGSPRTSSASRTVTATTAHVSVVGGKRHVESREGTSRGKMSKVEHTSQHRAHQIHKSKLGTHVVSSSSLSEAAGDFSSDDDVHIPLPASTGKRTKFVEKD